MTTSRTKPLAIAILLSGNGSNLKAIIDAINRYQLDIDIKCVISSNPKAYGLQRAIDHNISHHTLIPNEYSSRQAYDEAIANCLKIYEPELIVLAGFMRILGEAFVGQYSNKILNIHPSLLPAYPGLNTHQQAIDDGLHEHGCSIHIVTNDLDAGPVIAQAAVSIKKRDDASSLQKKVHTAEHFLYPTVLNWFAKQRITITTNQLYLDSIRLPETGLRFIVNQGL